MNAVSTPRAPAAIGPYSQAIVHGGLVYCSGQIALDPVTGVMVQGEIAAQTRQALNNLDAVLKAAGSGRARVIRTSVYLRDMADFPAMNTVYAEFFGDARPARATVAVSGLPKDGKVEIDCIAAVNEPATAAGGAAGPGAATGGTTSSTSWTTQG